MSDKQAPITIAFAIRDSETKEFFGITQIALTREEWEQGDRALIKLRNILYRHAPNPRKVEYAFMDPERKELPLQRMWGAWHSFTDLVWMCIYLETRGEE